MGNIDINFVSDGDFKKLVEQSELILKNSQQIAKQFESVSKKGMSAYMAKMAEMEKKIAILAEKHRQEQEKTAKLQQIATNELKKQLITEEKIKQEVEKTTFQKQKAELQIKKLTEQQERLNQKIKTGGKDMRGWGDALNSFQFKFNFLGNAIANVVSSLISGIKDFAVSSVKAFMEAENGDKRLLISLQKNQVAFDRLNAKAGEFQKRSIYDDDSIKAGMTFLAMQGRNEAQINKVIEGAMALSRVTGDDLDTSIKKLDQTFEGSIGKLGKLDSGFKTLTKEQLANGEAIDLVTKKYGSLINAVSTEDKLKQMENAWGDLKETFGGFASELLNGVLPAITEFFTTQTKIMSWNKELIDISFNDNKQFYLQQKQNTKELAKLMAMSNEERNAYHKANMAMLDEEGKKEYQRRIIKQIEIEQIKSRNRVRATERAKEQQELNERLLKEEEEKKKIKELQDIKREIAKIDKLTSIDYKKNKQDEINKVKELFDLYKEFYGEITPQIKEFNKVAEPDKTIIPEIDISFMDKLMSVIKSKNIGQALEDVFGINKEQQDTLKDGFNTALNAYSSFIDSKIGIANTDVRNSTNRINELTNLLQAEIQLNQQGYASNIQGRMQEIEAEEQIRKRALKDKEKYQKQSAVIDSAQVVASTAVSVANIFKVWSGVPFVGPILAGIQIGAMLLQIAAATKQAKAISKFGKGGKVGGRKHNAGGTLIEAELGEYVINADATEDYINTLQDINDKQSPSRIMRSLIKDTTKQGSDRDVLLKILGKFPDKNKKEIHIINNKIVEIVGNTTRYYN